MSNKMISLIEHISQMKTLHSLNEFIAESKTLHQNVNIAERLLINKEYVDPLNKNEIKEIGWRNVKIEDVDEKYADVNISTTPSYKRFYNKDGSPTNWFAWWMILCIYGPMSRKELLRCCDLPEDSYARTWADMKADNIIYYDSKLRASCPMPMSEWTSWK